MDVRVSRRVAVTNICIIANNITNVNSKGRAFYIMAYWEVLVAGSEGYRLAYSACLKRKYLLYFLLFTVPQQTLLVFTRTKTRVLISL